MRLSVVGWVGLLTALGCAPNYHRADRYRFDPVAAAELAEHAARECERRGEPAGRPTEPFLTDGCTLSPDEMFTGEVWQDCCVEHDIAYWCGGTERMRQDADDELKRCVGERYHPWMGALMKPAVRLGGVPWLPDYWRWGYGHKFPSGYSAPQD